MTTLDQVVAMLRDKFGVNTGTIDPDAPFESYHLDSLTVAELIFEIDEVFHIEIPDEAARTVKNLRELTGLIDALVERNKGHDGLSSGT